MDYEHKYSKITTSLSSTFANDIQDKFIIDALFWLSTGKKTGR
jgi:hypothetical protein